jgi:hypothetical protein
MKNEIVTNAITRHIAVIKISKKANYFTFIKTVFQVIALILR